MSDPVRDLCERVMEATRPFRSSRQAKDGDAAARALLVAWERVQGEGCIPRHYNATMLHDCGRCANCSARQRILAIVRGEE